MGSLGTPRDMHDYVVASRYLGVSILSFLFCLASIFAWASSRYVPSVKIFDVMDFGAVGDGKTDDSLAFLKAWARACKSTARSTLSIPDKTFLLNPLKFFGPCKSSNITVQISGKLTAPSDISEWKVSERDFWIQFGFIYGLTITGSGSAQIDGRGLSWWNCKNDKKCLKVPNFYPNFSDLLLQTLVINNTIGLRMNGLKFIDSPRMHLVIGHSSWVQVSQLYIVAPEDSPNTDGIHVTHSKHVEITDSIIGTGDDCISIETRSIDVNISRIKCGPGHGISIGSLGDDVAKAIVEKIHVSNCQFVGTMNGARIKTWQGGTGFARGITFVDFTMTAVDHPIVIDQYYCNGGHNCTNQCVGDLQQILITNAKTLAVQVSNVMFSRIKGSSTRKVAIDLACSETVPCTNIYLEDIVLRSTTPGNETTAYCDSVYGTASSVEPFVKCLA
ncbi:probable polygalacturonase At3g15720 [Telopea speciosissima]|uniref:probable polygalacturonase At3g15720 n=1 Tax=Telopea speciosissima TaxID=54955 RepID=UPI001CC66CE2|nr:probable polygalacturonase At3g15720 [Telopea speciosissima]